MKTAFILMTQYDGLAVIPVDVVCRDYFRHLTVEEFLRKVLAGTIEIVVTDGGVSVLELARYIDARRVAAEHEMQDASQLWEKFEAEWFRAEPDLLAFIAEIKGGQD